MSAEPAHPGCYNRKDYSDAHLARDGYVEHKVMVHRTIEQRRLEIKAVWIPHTMSTKCRSDYYKISRRCDGCSRLREDVEYFEGAGL